MARSDIEEVGVRFRVRITSPHQRIISLDDVAIYILHLNSPNQKEIGLLILSVSGIVVSVSIFKSSVEIRKKNT